MFDEEAIPDPLFATESIWGTQYFDPTIAKREVRQPESAREAHQPADAMPREERQEGERVLHDEEKTQSDTAEETPVPEKSPSRATLHDLDLGVARRAIAISVQKLSSEELRRAVILSEILAAPRSL